MRRIITAITAAVLVTVGLAACGGGSGGSSGGALMSQPRVILLDEPSLGLAPVVIDQIYERLELLRRDTGLAMVIVEQNSNRALSFCDSTSVMRLGEIVTTTGRDGLSEAELRTAYFGA